MINSLIEGILQLFITISTWIVGIILLPIYSLVSIFFPNFNEYLYYFNLFLNDYAFKGIAFAREVFFNVTGYPRPLLNLIVTFFVARVVFRLTLQVFRFLINMYRILRGNSPESDEP